MFWCAISILYFMAIYTFHNHSFSFCLVFEPFENRYRYIFVKRIFLKNQFLLWPSVILKKGTRYNGYRTEPYNIAREALDTQDTKCYLLVRSSFVCMRSQIIPTLYKREKIEGNITKAQEFIDRFTLAWNGIGCLF